MMGWTPLIFRHHRARWPHVVWGVSVNPKESDMNATAALPLVGVDLAQSVFQLAVADDSWRGGESHCLTRTQFERWFVNRAVGLVVMEACGSAHHWARWLNGLGIAVRLLPAAYIRAYIKRNKTDVADACALRRYHSGEDQVGRAAGIARAASHPLVVDGDPHLAHQRAARLLPRIRHRHRSRQSPRRRADRPRARRSACRSADIDPRHDDVGGRGNPPPGVAHRAARTRADRARPPITGMHHAVVDPRRRLAHRPPP